MPKKVWGFFFLCAKFKFRNKIYSPQFETISKQNDFFNYIYIIMFLIIIWVENELNLGFFVGKNRRRDCTTIEAARAGATARTRAEKRRKRTANNATTHFRYLFLY
jgi:hypothetical protein